MCACGWRSRGRPGKRSSFKSRNAGRRILRPAFLDLKLERFPGRPLDLHPQAHIGLAVLAERAEPGSKVVRFHWRWAFGGGGGEREREANGGSSHREGHYAEWFHM